MMKHLSSTAASSSNPFRKLIAVVVAVVVAGLGLMFSVVVFAIMLFLAVIVGIYLWWKTREIRKKMRDYASSGAEMQGDVFENDTGRGEVIEGEVVHVESPEKTTR